MIESFGIALAVVIFMPILLALAWQVVLVAVVMWLDLIDAMLPGRSAWRVDSLLMMDERPRDLVRMRQQMSEPRDRREP